MIPTWKIYPRSQGHSTVYLKNVITDPTIEVEALHWWDWDYEKIKRSIPAIQSADLAALEEAE